ncbi:MAG: hypothetical protein ACU84J_10895, partial [Gammaproteobacteria bacterium]
FIQYSFDSSSPKKLLMYVGNQENFYVPAIPSAAFPVSTHRLGNHRPQFAVDCSPKLRLEKMIEVTVS